MQASAKSPDSVCLTRVVSTLRVSGSERPCVDRSASLNCSSHINTSKAVLSEMRKHSRLPRRQGFM